MARQPRPYKRLTRATSSLASYRSLWLAADHLLVVSSTGYSEEYRRILLKNIQAFFVTSSNRKTWWAASWAAIGAISGLVMIWAFVDGATPVFSAIFTIIAVTGLVWNHMLGPGCKVYVVTGVQTLQLPSIVRRRRAGQILARLEPLIKAAQEELAPPPVPPAPPAAEPPPLA